MQLCQEESTVCCECFFISRLPRFLRCLVRDLNRQATWFACAAGVCFIQVQSIGNCKAIVIGFWFESSCPAIDTFAWCLFRHISLCHCRFLRVLGAWLWKRCVWSLASMATWSEQGDPGNVTMLTWRWLGVSHGRPREMYGLGSFVDWLRTQSSFGM